MFGREKFAMIVAEFLGTFALASVVLSMIYSRLGISFFQATVAGTALVVVGLLFARVQTGYYNPAITVGLWTMRKLETTKAVVLIAAQALGGLVAWTLGQYLLGTTVKNIANTTLDWRIFTAEAVGASLFGMGVAAALYYGYDGLYKGVALGGSLAVAMLVAGFAGNGLVNPAVAVGVQSWSFVYAAGPVLGAVVGMNVYNLLFVPAKAVTRATKTTTKSKKRK
jgi:aquaporin related protein